MTAKQLYARVHMGKVIESNVTELQIMNRGESKSAYMPQMFDYKPKTVKPYHFLKEVAEIFIDHVQIHYVQTHMDLDQLLLRVWNTEGDLKRPKTGVVIGDIPAAMVSAIAEASRIEMQDRLDTFAQTRGYDDIKSACTYATSAVPAFAAEGQRAVALRDSSWAVLYTYLSGVTAGSTPVPKNRDEIFATCPALTWA